MKAFSKIPFSSELFELSFPLQHIQNKLKPIKNGKFNYIKDILSFDNNLFLSLPHCGKNKLNYFIELKELLYKPETQQRIEELYEYCIVTHEFPENLTAQQRSLPPIERFDIAIKQYFNYLQKIAYFRNSKQLNIYADRIKHIIFENNSLHEIAEILNLTPERARQLKNIVISEILAGKVSGAENLKISASLQKELDDVVQSLPRICSHKTLCEKLCSANFEDMLARVFLPLKSAPETKNSLESSGYQSFDQMYYIRQTDSVKDTRSYIRTLFDALGNAPQHFEIRPINIERLMELMAKNMPNYPFDKQTVLDILVQHTWIETLTAEGETLYQIKYPYLKNDYSQIGRIVFERKSLRIDDIDKIHREKMNDENASSIIFSINPAKSKFPWVVNSGVSGYLEYSENGYKRTLIRQVIKQWISEHKLFTMDEIMAAFKEMGYTNIQERTFRAYITENCYSDVKNMNLFCNSDYIDEFKDKYVWRRKQQTGITNWIIKETYKYLIEAPEHKMLKKELNELLKSKSQELNNIYDIKYDIEYQLYHYMMKNDGLFVKDHEYIKLTERALKISPDKLENEATRKKSPAHYSTIKNKIIELVSQSDDKMMRLSLLKKECLKEYPDLLAAIFYKIVDRELPPNIVKISIDNKLYLKMEDEATSDKE